MGTSLEICTPASLLPRPKHPVSGIYPESPSTHTRLPPWPFSFSSKCFVVLLMQRFPLWAFILFLQLLNFLRQVSFIS